MNLADNYNVFPLAVSHHCTVLNTACYPNAEVSSNNDLYLKMKYNGYRLIAAKSGKRLDKNKL